MDSYLTSILAIPFNSVKYYALYLVLILFIVYLIKFLSSKKTTPNKKFTLNNYNLKILLFFIILSLVLFAIYSYYI